MISDRPGYEKAVKHYNHGVELHQAGHSDRAIAEYKAALKLYDGMLEAWDNLAGVYMAQQNYKAALEAVLRADSIKPDCAPTLDCYGQILFALGRDEEALIKFRRAIVVGPSYHSSYYNLADVLRRTGHDDEAKEVLKTLPKD